MKIYQIDQPVNFFQVCDSTSRLHIVSAHWLVWPHAVFITQSPRWRDNNKKEKKKKQNKKKIQIQGLKGYNHSQMEGWVSPLTFLWHCIPPPRAFSREFYVARSKQTTLFLEASADTERISDSGRLLWQTDSDGFLWPHIWPTLSWISNYTCIYTGVNISYFRVLGHS